MQHWLTCMSLMSPGLSLANVKQKRKSCFWDAHRWDIKVRKLLTNWKLYWFCRLILRCRTSSLITINIYIFSGDAVVAENDGVYDQVVSSLNFQRCHLSRFSSSSITSFWMTRKKEFCEPWIWEQVWYHEYADVYKMCAPWTCRIVQ